MAVQDAGRIDDRAGVAFFNDPRVRSWAYQLLLIAFIAWLGFVVVMNVRANLQAQNIASGWSFLNNTAGFGIIQTLAAYSEAASYGRALWIGFLNTLLVAAIGVVLATILGFIVGIARLSPNWLIARIATVYIEVIRNVPLLLQIFFWYFAALRAVPDKRSKISLFDTFHLNIAGLRGPKPIFEQGSWMIGVAIIVALVVIYFVRRWARRRQAATGQQFAMFRVGLAILIGLPLVAYFIAGMPVTIEHPVFNETGPVLRRGFELGTGFNLIPEFLALLLALVIYTAAFIGEIVRAGIMAVDKGQTEASNALGLRQNPTLRLVVVPQAMRVIIPPLISQFLNLTKNSSLAVAIAYPDLVAVGGTVLNQTGQAIEIVAIWMVVYLTISLITSMVMNWYNNAIALVER